MHAHALCVHVLAYLWFVVLVKVLEVVRAFVFKNIFVRHELSPKADSLVAQCFYLQEVLRLC